MMEGVAKALTRSGERLRSHRTTARAPDLEVVSGHASRARRRLLPCSSARGLSAGCTAEADARRVDDSSVWRTRSGWKREVLEGRLIWLAMRALRHGTNVVLDFGVWTMNERSPLRFLAQWARRRSSFTSRSAMRSRDAVLIEKPESTCVQQLGRHERKGVVMT
jgi:hypothetical protein